MNSNTKPSAESNGAETPKPPEQDLREQVRGVMQFTGLTQRQISRESGVNQSQINQWLQSKYAGDNAELEEKIKRWLVAQPRRDAAKGLRGPEWFSTPSAEQIIDALGVGQVVGDIVCIYGGPGVGKSVTLRHYQQNSPAVWIATMCPSMSGVIPALEEIAEAVGIREVPQGARRISRAIRKKIEGTQGLLIIDEAQHLSCAALEELRAIHDASRVGLALVGNETVYARLTGGTRANNFAQLFSRVGARLYLSKPSREDVEQFADAWRITGIDEIDFLEQIAKKPGALRGCDRVMKLASISQNTTAISVKHLRQAWSNLGAQE
jgi:DNA transposition AAA+ family ATPase